MTHLSPVSQNLTFPVSHAVGAGVSNLQSPTLNPTSPTEGEEGCGRPVLHCGVGIGAACGETKDVSKTQKNNRDRWELKVPSESPRLGRLTCFCEESFWSWLRPSMRGATGDRQCLPRASTARVAEPSALQKGPHPTNGATPCFWWWEGKQQGEKKRKRKNIPVIYSRLPALQQPCSARITGNTSSLSRKESKAPRQTELLRGEQWERPSTSCSSLHSTFSAFLGFPFFRCCCRFSLAAGGDALSPPGRAARRG